MNVVKTVRAAAANSDQSLQSIFDDIYPELFSDKCENVKFLLYFDLDKNEFAMYDDEGGQYRRAFERQHNVVTIGYVDVGSALTRSLEEIVEYWAQSNF